jgi:hypothetical protein
MYIIFRCFYQQFANYWKSLELRIKIEIFLLILIFYSFFSERLITLFTDLLSRPTISTLGLNSFVSHLIVLVFSLSIPFIYFKIIPRQESLRALQILPLSSNNALAVIFTFIARYELATLIFSGPVLVALFITCGILPLLYTIFILIFIPVTSLLLIQNFLLMFGKRQTIIVLYLFIIFIYFVAHVFLYLNNYPYAIIDLALFPAIFILLLRRLHPFSDHWDLPLHMLRIKTVALQKVSYALGYDRIPNFLPTKIQPYFSREFLGHIRNRNYIRMLILSLVLFIILIIFIGNKNPNLIAVICFLFCWLHYAHQFNEKYIFLDSKDLISVLPVRYYQIWLSKFITEVIFLIPILLISLISLIVYELSAIRGLLIFLALVIFALLILFIITTIRLLFLDSARKAGYAYHFLIIFSFVMVTNFFLVGPVVIFGLLIYLSFLSYRQFSH